MEYITLGKTGLRVSRMGFGGIPIQKVDASVTHALMERLAQRGVNYIDTARGYTVSEQFLGEALEGGLREKFVVFEDMKKGLPTCRQSRLYTAYLQPHSYEPHILSSLFPE